MMVMLASGRFTTTVSTKGQVILPKPIRDQKHWGAGTRLIVEDTGDGVFLRPAPIFPPTRPEDVFGMLRYRGTPKTLEEMDAGIAAEVKRWHARNRY
jgi:AbrB family looped-hinge helix DNA binding protein